MTVRRSPRLTVKSQDAQFELAPPPAKVPAKKENGEANRLDPRDRPAHDWYRFVLSFPPHLVASVLDRFGISAQHTVLDPFCGTGTTLVECKKRGIPSIGIEAHPMAHFASSVKTDWSVDPRGLAEHTTEVCAATESLFRAEGVAGQTSFSLERRAYQYGLRRLDEEAHELLLKGSISALPLHKTLLLLEIIDRTRYDRRFAAHERLALAKALVTQIGNLEFGPEVGVGEARSDAPVLAAWQNNVAAMADDLASLGPMEATPAQAILSDSRSLDHVLAPESIDAVITSPPYPNEKDYTRTTRLESVVLGLIRNKYELQALKRGLVRSNTRNVFVDDDDDEWVAQHPEIQRIADEIEARRVELGKTSGFERLYARVTRLYFGGMARHLAELRVALRRGAQLAYVVGDQASYLRVMIRTGDLLGKISQALGYEVESIDLFRTRLATSTRDQLREEVVVLRWPGDQTAITTGVEMPKRDGDRGPNRYSRIIEKIFFSHYEEGLLEIEFDRFEIEQAAAELGISLPKNLGDVVYSFRYRNSLPQSVRERAPAGSDWIIRAAGRSRYRFVAAVQSIIVPRAGIPETKVPDATPGVIAMYALDDEQALLAKLRYNRLIDTFTGVTCYSLQSHLRTQVPDVGQVETDEVYVGIDKRGAHYVFPVQAKGGRDKQSIVQIEQDIAMAGHKFPKLICRPIAAQFVGPDLIALFLYEQGADGPVELAEKHYRLVPPEQLTGDELDQYRNRPE